MRQCALAPSARATSRQFVSTVRCRPRAASACANRLVVDPQSIISASPGSTSAAAAAPIARALRRMRPAALADAGLVGQRAARAAAVGPLERAASARSSRSRRAVSVVTSNSSASVAMRTVPSCRTSATICAWRSCCVRRACRAAAHDGIRASGIAGEVEERVAVAQESRFAHGARRRTRASRPICAGVVGPPARLQDVGNARAGSATRVHCRRATRSQRSRACSVSDAARPRATAPCSRIRASRTARSRDRTVDAASTSDSAVACRRRRRRFEHPLLHPRHRQRRDRHLLAVQIDCAMRREHVDVMADEMLALARRIAAAADRHPEAGQHERARERAHRIEVAATSASGASSHAGSSSASSANGAAR